MAFSGTGDYTVAGIIAAGQAADGTVTLTGGTYGVSQVIAGQTSADNQTITGRIELTGGTTDVTADNSSAGSGAVTTSLGQLSGTNTDAFNTRGLLYITNGATFESVGGSRNVQAGVGQAYGLISVSGSGSSFRATGADTGVQLGGYGDYATGRLTITSGATGLVSGDGAQVVLGVDTVGGASADRVSRGYVSLLFGGELTIDSGNEDASGATASLRIGATKGDDGSVALFGTGSRLDLVSSSTDPAHAKAAAMEVGSLGTGRLHIEGSNVVTARSLDVGLLARGTDQNGNPVTTTGYLASVSYAGNGRVSVLDGGQLLLTPADTNIYRGMEVGSASGTTGQVGVSGEGSLLSVQGGASFNVIGRYGTGSLDLRYGGDAKGFFFEVGRGNGSSGTVSVDGAGSTLYMSDAFGSFASPGYGAFLRIGRNAGSYGKVSITNGGRVDLQNATGSTADGATVEIGRGYGATGVLEVDGSGSVLDVTLTGPSNDTYAPGSGTYYGPMVRLGRFGGNGSATVSNGGAVNIDGENARLRIGYGDPSNASAPAAESVFSITSGADVTVNSSGAEVGASVSVGHNASGKGRLVLDGAGSSLTVSSDNADDTLPSGFTTFGASLDIGREGTGTLVLTDGATIDVDGADDLRPAFFVGRGANDGSAAAMGTATVSGSGSAITVAGTYASGTGSGGLIAIGYHAGASGTLTISGGAGVSATSANAVIGIGVNAGATGNVTVTGTGSTLETAGLLTIGEDIVPVTVGVGGTGSLTVADGGAVTAATAVIGATGTLDIDGSLTGDLTVRGAVVVGGSGTVGTFQHSGALAFEGSGAIEIDILDFAPGQSDLVSTDVTLDGAALIAALDIVIDAGVTFDPGESLVLVQSTGGISAVNQTFTATDGTEFVLHSGGGNTLVIVAPVTPVIGTEGNDVLFGSAFNDDIRGLGGNDLIFGQAGADTMTGGTGNDRYFVDDAGDIVIEEAGEGRDRINTSISLTLAENVEDATLDAGAVSVTGNAGVNWIVGNADANTLSGLAGDDRLQGEGGADVIDGGAGNDVLEGGADADRFVFNDDDGRDLVLDFQVGVDVIDLTSTGLAFVDLTIVDASGGALIIYDLTPGSTDLIQLRGVSVADITSSDVLTVFGQAQPPIVGTEGNDVIFGTIFDDEIQGLGGSDQLRGQAGADTMIGGAGDDRYFVDDAGDIVVEEAGEGRDRVNTSVSLTLAENVEDATLEAGAVDVTGNAGVNWIVGNAVGNSLSGLEGNDRLQGEGGADVVDGGAGNDVLQGGTDADRFVFDLDDGSDLILDFEIGVDVIDLTSTGLAFEDLTIADSANGALIIYDLTPGGVDLIQLAGVAAADVTEDDFLIAPP